MNELGYVYFNDPSVFIGLLDFPEDLCKKTKIKYNGTGQEISIPNDYPKAIEINGSYKNIDYHINIADYMEDEIKSRCTTCISIIEYHKQDDSDLDKAEKIDFIEEISKKFNATIGFYLYDGFYAIENSLEEENFSVYNNGVFQSFYKDQTDYESKNEDKVYLDPMVIDILMQYKIKLETLIKIVNIKKKKK